ncbi:tetratricopeptide repeat protein [Ruminococcus albus]|uniref:Tetratricopeptide TPR_1 repeat-containing protein n=1 Tax=Ruminococcus albus (strain ATCC 27210 / DSM 20455 / JCM 14654 / NCDO 2250 / 7) TaxID=697329 RepID=E6UH03_RUMA7|nr:tetratricopeptide repeat protein [Ruminococcus albus]ADU21190.1 Tetratricopeptide TPR_1 repeat-containing protein [Ruminococcus albus 7 = DSM 20455]
MDFDELMAVGKNAFVTADFKTAAEYGVEGHKLRPKDPEPLELAAKAYQAMENSKEAIFYFQKAAQCDIDNGDRYVELGVAYGSNGDTMKALEAFAEAERHEISEDHLSGMYRTLAMVDQELGRYEDAIVNFTKAQESGTIDIELLMYKTVACSMAGKYGEALRTANMIKQLAPTSYDGYELAYTILVNFEQYEEANKELLRAKKYVKELPMEYYFSVSDYEMEMYKNDKENDHLVAALCMLDMGLKETKPDVGEVVNAYIKSADICLQAGKYEEALQMLQAADQPVQSFNGGFSVLPWVEPPEFDSPLSDAYFAANSAKYDGMSSEELNREAEAMAAKAMQESEEPVDPDMLTPIPEDKPEEYKLPNEPRELSEEVKDRMNLLYVTAYTALNKYDRVLEYAIKLQSSKEATLVNTARYLETKARIDMGVSEPERLYDELIRYYNRQIIKDPSDISVLGYKVQCYIDQEKYDEAISYCRTLSNNVKEPLMKQIRDAQKKSEEGAEDGTT